MTGHCPSITRNASIPQRMMTIYADTPSRKLFCPYILWLEKRRLLIVKRRFLVAKRRFLVVKRRFLM